MPNYLLPRKGLWSYKAILLGHFRSIFAVATNVSLHTPVLLTAMTLCRKTCYKVTSQCKNNSRNASLKILHSFLPGYKQSFLDFPGPSHVFACRGSAAVPTLEPQGGISQGFLVTLIHALKQLGLWCFSAWKTSSIMGKKEEREEVNL